jgi:hypothetical protein
LPSEPVSRRLSKAKSGIQFQRMHRLCIFLSECFSREWEIIDEVSFDCEETAGFGPCSEGGELIAG